jgi:hypothetical protein
MSDPAPPSTAATEPAAAGPATPSAPAAGIERHGPGFWIGAAVGTATMVYGAVNLVDAAPASRPSNWLTWFLGAGVVHDALFAPLAVAVGWLTLRAVPRVARAPVRVALASSALLVLVTWPLVRRWGARESIPSLMPLDYGRNLVLGLCAIWAATAGVVAWRVVRRRRAAR